MTPAWKPQQGYHAPGEKWKATIPAISTSSHIGDGPRHWAPHPHPAGAPLGAPPRPRCPPPPLPPPLQPALPLFRTRHAEQSAGRPRLVTIVRPCGQSDLRKVTVLLNRRGVVSFEQLLLDVSEALGFPRWHRGRVTRLFTPHGREVKGVCDFFRGEVAFLALGRARPEPGSVREALEELFPEQCRYRADAVRAWERRLRPPPDKAAKADSGYSEETAGDETNARAHAKREARREATARTQQNTPRRPSQPPAHAGKTRPRHDHDSPGRRPPKEKHPCRQPTHPPNHLQALRGKGGAREKPPAAVGPFNADEAPRDEHAASPSLCHNCLAGRNKQLAGSEVPNQMPRRAPLPPVSRKPKQSAAAKHHGGARPGAAAPPPGNRDEEQCREQLRHSSIDSPQEACPAPQEEEAPPRWVPFDLLRDKKDVTLADIERCYDIGRVIGDGNFAVVRECRRRDTGQSLALKVVERSKLIGREHMMQNELSLLGSLSHPCVVRLFAHYHTHTQAYLVMELVNGGDLFEAIARRGRFPEGEAGLIVADVGGALSYIHGKSIVHRDLKPENLLIECRADGSNRLKLGDFGLAMVVTEPIFTVCGTPTYVAPEILSETGYGLSVDVWALGVILYILLCGFPPFRSQDRDQEELFRLIREGKVHFLPTYWDPVSEGAKELVRGLLQVNPIERLSASQSLQHPWVQAMATAGRQGALTHRPQKTTAAAAAAAAAAAESRDRQAQTYTGKAPGDKRPERADSRPGLTHKAQLSATAEAAGPHGATGREISAEAPDARGEGSRPAAHAAKPHAVVEAGAAEEAGEAEEAGAAEASTAEADAVQSARPGSSPAPLTWRPPPQTSPPETPSPSPRSGTSHTPAPSPPGPARDLQGQAAPSGTSES